MAAALTTLAPAWAQESGTSGAGPPRWAQGAVWYQVFPDRFSNGNPLNDPPGPAVFRPGWLSSWRGTSLAEFEASWFAAEGDPLRQFPGGRGAVFGRRYGGDLQGLVARLDDVRNLGIDAIYLCPVFESSSSHGYDAGDFRHIDRHLGHPGTPPPGEGPPAGETEDPSTWTWTPADRYFVDTVVPEVHRRGMRIILDGVWNHVGLDHWAFRDVMQRGRASAYAGWFECRFSGGGELVGWRAWDGPNGRLPRLAHTPEGDLAAAVKAHIFDVTRRWMDPDGDGDPGDGVDGWRLDVAPEIGRVFWRDWRALVKGINPDAALYGEVWSDAAEYFDGTAFDAQMNYPFAAPAVRWLRGYEGSEGLAAALGRAFAHERGTDLAQMNLLVSHDTARLATMMARGPGPYDGAQTRGPGGRPSPEARALAVVGVALQSTYLGSPMVYYGEEWGMEGGDDPHCRKPLPWPDLGAVEDPADAPAADHRAEVRRWLWLRSDPVLGPLLRYGGVTHRASGHADVFAFERTHAGRTILVALNRGSTPAALPAAGWAGVAGGQEVPARSGRVWLDPLGR